MDMPETNLFALLLVGLLGGTHCVGMCGGIVSAFTLGSAGRWPLMLAYNFGRLLSYVLAGTLVGALGAASLGVSHAQSGRLILYFLANLMLIALGVYLLGQTRALAFTERVGHVLWRYLQPLTRRFLPARTVLQAFPLGLLWGWLPCGLVYSALAMALSSGSALNGALSMLAFGLGTLPNLLLAGILLARLNAFVKQAWVRGMAGGLVLLYGCYGLLGTLRLMASI